MKVINNAASFSNVWEDVKVDLERKILNGAFAGGERIPSIRALADEYGIGQSTAQKVLNALWQDGIIEPQRGVGYFVKPYIQERIIADRRRVLEKTVMRAIEEAELLNIDILAMVQTCVSIKRERSK